MESAVNLREGLSFESSCALWVRADAENEALAKGREYAERYVAALFQQVGVADFAGWAAGEFAHWIEQTPQDRFPGVALESLEEME